MINDSEMTLYCVDIIIFGLQFGVNTGVRLSSMVLTYYENILTSSVHMLSVVWCSSSLKRPITFPVYVIVGSGNSDRAIVHLG